jgi:hypothetical protein
VKQVAAIEYEKKVNRPLAGAVKERDMVNFRKNVELSRVSKVPIFLCGTTLIANRLFKKCFLHFPVFINLRLLKRF